MEELSDEVIAARVQAGEVEAFGQLLFRYEAKMLRYASKFLINGEDAADVVQTVFLKAYTNIQSFDPGRKFSSWLYRIAHNEFVNIVAKRSRQSFSFLSLDEVLPHPFATERADTELERNELRQSMEACLQKMDAKYREVLVLYYYQELSYTEIADVLHIPTSTVGVRLGRAKKVISELYKNESHARA
ncbi:MAG: RNA polymerase sigma factor [Candidatus Doudnabacteria bacterium]|nr:RNA polymerase sigma factor [Candidatus Doudnabacteria bacterium]